MRLSMPTSQTGPGGMPLLVHLRWVKYADLLLVTRPAAPGPQGQGVVLSFSAYLAERTVDDIAAQAATAGGQGDGGSELLCG